MAKGVLSSLTRMEFNRGQRGRRAARPREIPRAGWRDVLLRTRKCVAEHHLSVVAAGVAFYALLAIFPGLAALVSIYGLAASPEAIEQQLNALTGMLPQGARSALRGQMGAITSGAGSALGLGVAAGLALALWSAAGGVRTLIIALNIVYGEQETRGLIKRSALALGLTLAAILVVILALALVVAVPVALDYIGLGALEATLIAWGRWPLLLILAMLALAVIYRFGPNRAAPRWQWVSWGTVLATALWLIGSGLFSFYVANFGSYNETYGSVGAIVILLLWFFLTAYAILLGAELNAQMEHQTGQDTTSGPSQPLGERGAFVADTVAERP